MNRRLHLIKVALLALFLLAAPASSANQSAFAQDSSAPGVENLGASPAFDTMLSLDDARGLIENGELKDALAAIREYVQRFPFDAEAYSLGGLVFDELDYLRLASNSYLVAAKLDKKYSADYLRLKTDANSEAEYLNRFESGAASMLEANPFDIPALITMAKVRLAQNATSEADRLVRRGESSDDAEFNEQLSLLSEKIHDNYLLASSEKAAASLDSARSLSSTGQYQDSILRYRQLLVEHGETNKLLLLELSSVYKSAGDYFSALRFLEEAGQHMPKRQLDLLRADLQIEAGLVSEAAAAYVVLYKEDPTDNEVSDRLTTVFPLLRNYPQASAQVTEVRPDLFFEEPENLVLSSDAVQSSTIGIRLTPTIGYKIVDSNNYSFEDFHQSLVFAYAPSRRLEIEAGLSTHKLKGSERFEVRSNTLDDRLTEYSISLTTTGARAARVNATDPYRLTIKAGVANYKSGRTRPFFASSVERSIGPHVKTGLGVSSTEAALILNTPAGGRADATVNQANIFVATSSASLIKARADLQILRATDDREFSPDTESVRNNLGNTAGASVGLRVVPFGHVGVAYRQIDFEDFVDLYWAPSFYQRFEGWVEYERPITGGNLRLRSGLATVRDSDQPLLPFADGTFDIKLNQQIGIGLSGSFSRDARLIVVSRPNASDDIFDLAEIQGFLSWHF